MSEPTSTTAAAAAPAIEEVKVESASAPAPAPAEPEVKKDSPETEPDSKATSAPEEEIPKETFPQEIIDPEPQKSLTEKFTDQEWTALKEFRVCYPSSRTHQA